MSISAVILAKNEEHSLPRLLRSLTWADEAVVVDDESSDRTAQVAQSFGARVVTRRLEDFSSQRNAGLEAARSGWVLSLDADEEVPEESATLLQKAAREAPPEVGGFRILRRNYALGRWLRHGRQFAKRVAWYDFVRLARGHRVGEYLGGAVKLFRRKGARYRNLVHEEVVTPGRVIQLQAYVNHYTAESIHDLFAKVEFYTTLHARDHRAAHPRAPRHWLSKLLWTPPATFWADYVRRRGFLDGFPGLVRAYASAWYEFLKLAKLYDYYQGPRGPRKGA